VPPEKVVTFPSKTPSLPVPLEIVPELVMPPEKAETSSAVPFALMLTTMPLWPAEISQHWKYRRRRSRR
jgi:hypothetical protein